MDKYYRAHQVDAKLIGNWYSVQNKADSIFFEKNNIISMFTYDTSPMLYGECFTRGNYIYVKSFLYGENDMFPCAARYEIKNDTLSISRKVRIQDYRKPPLWNPWFEKLIWRFVKQK